jgi:hypothetical protein
MASTLKPKPSLQVSLIKTPTDKGRPFNIYHLKVKDTSGKWPDKEMLVADLQRSGGGISLIKWKLNWYEDRPVISAYLEVSIMGHDLDQWVHYDWDTGERLENFEPSSNQLAK